jgi:hypothetical protein
MYSPHACYPLVPALDDLPFTKGEAEGFPFFIAAVKLRTISELALQIKVVATAALWKKHNIADSSCWYDASGSGAATVTVYLLKSITVRPATTACQARANPTYQHTCWSHPFPETLTV